VKPRVARHQYRAEFPQSLNKLAGTPHHESRLDDAGPNQSLDEAY
jgi:hypothetical protein